MRGPSGLRKYESSVQFSYPTTVLARNNCEKVSSQNRSPRGSQPGPLPPYRGRTAANGPDYCWPARNRLYLLPSPIVLERRHTNHRQEFSLVHWPVFYACAVPCRSPGVQTCCTGTSPQTYKGERPGGLPRRRVLAYAPLGPRRSFLSPCVVR